MPTHRLLCWHEQEPVSYTETCTVPDAASIEATLVPPTRPSGLKASGLSQPPQSPPMVPDDTCNKFLPNDSTEDRFIWVMRCDLRHPVFWDLAQAPCTTRCPRCSAAMAHTFWELRQALLR